MRKVFDFSAGILFGVVSWAICLIFGKFEPFDTEVGFYLGQLLLSLVAFYFGYSRGFIGLIFLLIGMHVGQNTYSFFYGSGESRAWFLLGLLTTLTLLIFPLFSGMLGFAIKTIRRKRSSR